ncbi:MAG: hypothetical protein JJ952_14705 [Pseudomonadales bacterium]|nr:hypothetical protein [Pseudomonadales bacterium]
MTRRNNQDGVALLMLLTILLLGVSTALVTKITPNDRRNERPLSNASVLDLVRQSLVGYSLLQTVGGVLPCPDTDGDGFSDPQGLGCDDQLGLVPHRTLDLDNLSDSTGAPLWYAVSLDLLSNAPTTKNSSTGSSLTLDGTPVAAVVIAPGVALDGQSRSVISADAYLEGINADANRDDYDTQVGATQNDQVLALRRETLWSMVESRANNTALALMQSYRASCGEYPWAATFGDAANSVASQQTGALPLGTALPFDWGAACGLSFAPAVDVWLAAHWQDQMFYSMCTTAQGSCLTALNSTVASGSLIVTSPGIEFAGQARPGGLSEYFEDENADSDQTEFVYRDVFDHDQNFNDTVLVGP